MLPDLEVMQLLALGKGGGGLQKVPHLLIVDLHVTGEHTHTARTHKKHMEKDKRKAKDNNKINCSETEECNSIRVDGLYNME